MCNKFKLNQFALILIVTSMCVSGCGVDKYEFRANLVREINTNLESNINKTNPMWIDCFSIPHGSKIDMIVSSYIKCIYELDEKLPDTVSSGLELNEWSAEVDACALVYYINDLFSKNGAELASYDEQCLSVMNGYYLVATDSEKHKKAMEAYDELLIGNMSSSFSGSIICFDTDKATILERMKESYKEALDPLRSEYLHKLPFDKKKIEQQFVEVGISFARSYYRHNRQLYSTAGLVAKDREYCEDVTLRDIKTYFPHFVVPSTKNNTTKSSKAKNKDRKKILDQEEKLIEVKYLYDKGVITKKEYDQKRKSILDKLFNE